MLVCLFTDSFYTFPTTGPGIIIYFISFSLHAGVPQNGSRLRQSHQLGKRRSTFGRFKQRDRRKRRQKGEAMEISDQGCVVVLNMHPTKKCRTS